MMVDNSKLAAAIALTALCAAPIGAAAQTPSYATRTETITGSIESVQNVNHIFVADDRGFSDDVTLRSGASVSGGVRLEPGARVTIRGSAAGRTFIATSITTSGRSYAADVATAAPSYQQSYPVPVPVYYPAPAYYTPSMYYGYGPYSYGYGFGISFGRSYRVFRHGYGRPFWGYGSLYGSHRPYRSPGVGVFVHVR